jgi:hypothetical protein
VVLNSSVALAVEAAARKAMARMRFISMAPGAL